MLNCTDTVNVEESYLKSTDLNDEIEYRCSCDNCKLFDLGNYTEIYKIKFDDKQIKLEENLRKIRIDNIRDMFSNIIEKPIMGKYKIFYIKYPENMNINAQNALLKILEEPPKYTIIILAGKNINILLPTIKSRCTKLYVFNKEEVFCKNLKEDFEGKDNPFNLYYKDIVNLDKYIFYNKYKKLFIRSNYKSNIIFLEEALSCFFKDKSNKESKLYKVFLETNKRIEGNCNFEMLIDYFLLTSWELINNQK